MRTRTLMIGLTVGASLGLAAPAAAAPQGGEVLTLRCDHLGEIEIAVAPGQGDWTPGFVVGTTQRLIPYAFEFEFGGEVEMISKPAPRHGRLDRCEFGDEEFSGTAWVSYTSR